MAELGRAASAVHAVERQGEVSPGLQDAQRSLDEATTKVSEIARSTEADLRAIAAAWEAIAVAHDTACRAHEAVVTARSQFAQMVALRRDAEPRGRRARNHAVRILRWWTRRHDPFLE